MKYRNRCNIKVRDTRVFSVSFAEVRRVAGWGLFYISGLINKVNSQGLAYFNSILSDISSKEKHDNEIG
jgi:hypothetical protein